MQLLAAAFNHFLAYPCSCEDSKPSGKSLGGVEFGDAWSPGASKQDRRANDNYSATATRCTSVATAVAHDCSAIHNLQTAEHSAHHRDEREKALQKVRVRQREAQGVARVRAVQRDQLSGPCSSMEFIHFSHSTVLPPRKAVTDSVDPT